MVGAWLKPGTRCASFGAHVVERIDQCDSCGDAVDSCEECEVVTSCCWCGKYHSIDCPAV